MYVYIMNPLFSVSIRTRPSPSPTSDPPSLSDRDLLAGALEVIVILWEGLKETLDSPQHERLRSRLVSSVTESLLLLFNSLTVRLPVPFPDWTTQLYSGWTTFRHSHIALLCPVSRLDDPFLLWMTRF